MGESVVAFQIFQGPGPSQITRNIGSCDTRTVQGWAVTCDRRENGRSLSRFRQDPTGAENIDLSPARPGHSTTQPAGPPIAKNTLRHHLNREEVTLITPSPVSVTPPQASCPFRV